MHISDLNRYSRCPLMYRFSMQDTSNDYFPYFNFAVNPKDSIKNKFHIEAAYYGSPNETNEQTFEALKKKYGSFPLTRDMIIDLFRQDKYFDGFLCAMVWDYLDTSFYSTDDYNFSQMHMMLSPHNVDISF